MKKLVLSLLIVLMSAAAQAQTPTYWASCDSEDRSISFDRETYIDHSEGKKNLQELEWLYPFERR